jgi:hypothetical protein
MSRLLCPVICLTPSPLSALSLGHPPNAVSGEREAVQAKAWGRLSPPHAFA